MEKITLTKPFKLQNGTEIKEFNLKFEELSVADFRQIQRFETQICDAESVSMMDAVNDKQLKFEFQLASGFLAAMKGTEGLMASDFLRLPMHDSLMLAKMASFFWLALDLGPTGISEISTQPLDGSQSSSTQT